MGQNNSKQEIRTEPKPNSSKFDELKDEKTLISPQINLKMTSNQWNQLIKEIFLFEMPKDFFQLWHFCKSVKPGKPEGLLGYNLMEEFYYNLSLFRCSHRYVRPTISRSL